MREEPIFYEGAGLTWDRAGGAFLEGLHYKDVLQHGSQGVKYQTNQSGTVMHEPECLCAYG